MCPDNRVFAPKRNHKCGYSIHRELDSPKAGLKSPFLVPLFEEVYELTLIITELSRFGVAMATETRAHGYIATLERFVN